MMIKGKAQKAYQTMIAHRMNCAQSVLTTFCEELRLDKSLAMRVARAFGGGMGQSGGTCGAVTGAYMVLGLALKRSGDYRKDRTNMTAAMDEFRKRFKRLHGSLNCTELTGYDLSIPGEAVKAHDNNVFSDVCPKLVRDAAKILEDILQKK
jgi:C_GCAxxG_C_C family probable redox protein